MTLHPPPVELVEECARRLRITDHRTGATVPMVPSPEQRAIWDVVCSGQWAYFAKPRQVFATTACTLYDVLWVWAQDVAGHRVRAAIVVDSDEKTRERARLAGDFAAQLGIGAASTSERLVFRGGSELVFFTAGGSRAGAGTSFQLLHLSELPFWPGHVDTYGSLLPALGIDGQVIIETTIDVSAPTGQLARDLWRSSNRYVKRFFSVEDHAHEYAADPSLLTGEEWEVCRGEGFRRRDSAAWWLKVALPNLVGGDITRLMREYPQREEHMFQASASRWVSTTPATRAPLRTVLVGNAAVCIWREPRDTSHQLVLGVDTAAGKERDRSALALIDKRDGALCASLVDDRVTTHELAQAVQAVVGLYVHQAPAPMPLMGPPLPDRPEVTVEDNGIGQGTVDACRALGLQVHAVTTDAASQYEGLLLAKHAVEAGKLHGPADLALECDELHRDDHGRWKGRKDLLMACGFALRRIKASPYRSAPPPKDPDRYDVRSMLRRQMGRGREW